MSELKDTVTKIVGGLERIKPPEGVSHPDPMREATQESSQTAGTLAIRPLALPNNARRMFNDIFGDYKIQKKDLQPEFFEGKEMFKCVKKGQHANVSYYLAKEVVSKKIPSLDYMELAYKVSLIMGFEQGSSKISFTLGDKAEKMGYSKERIKKSGAFFEQLDRTEKAIAGMTIHRKGKDKGGKIVEHIGSLCSLTKRGNGKGATYEVSINTDFTQGMNFETGVVETPYTRDPIMLMTNRTIPRSEKNLRIALNTFIGLKKFHPYGSTLLGFAKISKRDIKRKAIREKTYRLSMKLLKEMGFELVSVNGQEKSKDFRKWQFHFKPPESKKTQQPEFTFMGSAETKKFIDTFVEWQGRQAHYGKKGAILTENRIRDMITNTIRGYGFKVVKQLFDSIQRTSDPSPKHFWTEIKALKSLKAVDNFEKGVQE